MDLVVVVVYSVRIVFGDLISLLLHLYFSKIIPAYLSSAAVAVHFEFSYFLVFSVIFSPWTINFSPIKLRCSTKARRFCYRIL